MAELALHEDIFNKAINKIMREEAVVARYYCEKEMRKKKVFTCLSILGALKSSMSRFIKEEIFEAALNEAKKHPELKRPTLPEEKEDEDFITMISKFDWKNLKEHKDYMRQEIDKYMKYYDEIYVILSWSTAAFFSLFEEFDEHRIRQLKDWALFEVYKA